MSPVESRPNPSLGRKFSKKIQDRFFRITALHNRNNTWKHYLNLVSALTRPPPCQAQLQVTLVLTYFQDVHFHIQPTKLSRHRKFKVNNLPCNRNNLIHKPP